MKILLYKSTIKHYYCVMKHKLAPNYCFLKFDFICNFFWKGRHTPVLRSDDQDPDKKKWQKGVHRDDSHLGEGGSESV